MSPEKLASQVGHVCKELGRKDVMSFIQKSIKDDIIIVLGLRKNKFVEKLAEINITHHYNLHVQVDLGLTEVNAGTITAFGYIKNK